MERLASVGVVGPITYPNGDRSTYLDHVFACTWVAGEPHVADDESVAVGWFGLDQLPPMRQEMLDRIDAAISGEERARVRRLIDSPRRMCSRSGRNTTHSSWTIGLGPAA